MARLASPGCRFIHDRVQLETHYFAAKVASGSRQHHLGRASLWSLIAWLAGRTACSLPAIQVGALGDRSGRPRQATGYRSDEGPGCDRKVGHGRLGRIRACLRDHRRLRRQRRGPGGGRAWPGHRHRLGAFGIVAGVLFGLWTSRSVSVRRLKGIGPLVPPGSSVVVGWATRSVPAAATGGWLATGSQRLLVRFVAGERGPVLDVPALDVPA
jgi:hypothetical protein